MLALVPFAVLAVAMEPVALAQGPEVHGAGALVAASLAAEPAAETAPGVGSDSAARPRGQPRVSKTRCAFVTCEAQCDIKGARDAQGAPVYRTPASPAYGRTNAERMFCSRADATAAGYREEAQG